MLRDNRYENKNPEELKPMFDEIYERNKRSQANGSLMRISPMAFFLALTGEEPLEHA
jgi:ADP-ribosylglycohydrolase